MVHGIGAGVARRIDNNSTTERTSVAPAANNINEERDLLHSERSNLDDRHHHTHTIKLYNRNSNSSNSSNNSNDIDSIKMNESHHKHSHAHTLNGASSKFDETDELVEDTTNDVISDDISIQVDSNGSNDDGDVDADIDIDEAAASSSNLLPSESALASPLSSSSSSSNLTATLTFLTMTIIVFVCIFYFSNNLVAFLELVEKSGLWGNLIFVLSYLPTGIPLAIFSLYIPLTVASGYVYGFVHGFATTMVGSVLSAAFGFWITRKFFVKWLESKIESSPKLSSIRSMVEHHPFKIIIILRILPIPFGLQNSLCAVTRLSFTTFIYSTAIGLIPENSLIVYIGTTTKNLADISSGGHYQQTLLVVAIVVGILLLIIGKKVLSSPSPLFNTPTITISSSSNIHESTNSNNQKQIESTRDIILTIKSSSTSLTGLSSNNIISNNSSNNTTNSTKPQSLPSTPFKSRIE